MSETKKGTSKYLMGFIIAFVGALFFSTKAVIVKHAFINTDVDAVTLLALRMIFALPFYVSVGLFASNKITATPFTKKQWVYVIGLGLAGYYLSSLFDFIGLQYISAGLERLILFLYPTFVVLMNAFIFKQKIKPVQKLALILTYIGIGVAYFSELKFNTSNANFFIGSFFVFLCAVTFAAYIAGSGKLIPQTGATRFTAYAMIASSIGVLAHYFLTGNTIHHFSTPLLWYGLILGIVATVLPTFMVSGAIKKIGANNVAIISSIGPVSTILQAHYVLGEHITIAQIAGTILVIVGVILIGWKGGESN
ncbi:DMT family transporter [Ferruginibacter sp. SUN002]|uniref:DMT family transporter n=1 Tax=Ferruginibacter sp. SUN002 TaxID=2937789 RepID=UPI003D369045